MTRIRVGSTALLGCILSVVGTLALLDAASKIPNGWRHFAAGCALAGGFTLWKEAEKIGMPKAKSIDQADIEADEELAEAVETINEYVKRRDSMPNVQAEGDGCLARRLRKQLA